MLPTRSLAFTVALLLGASLAGGADPSPHACSLLSRAEFQTIAGEAVAEPRRGPSFPPPKPDVTVSQCTYDSADGARSLTLLVRMSRSGDNDPDYVRRSFGRGGILVQELPGLGDQAFWAGRQLNAFKGPHLQVVVTVAGFADAGEFATARERAEKVARRALERLRRLAPAGAATTAG